MTERGVCRSGCRSWILPVQDLAPSEGANSSTLYTQEGHVSSKLQGFPQFCQNLRGENCQSQQRKLGCPGRRDATRRLCDSSPGDAKVENEAIRSVFRAWEDLASNFCFFSATVFSLGGGKVYVNWSVLMLGRQNRMVRWREM